MSFCTNCGKQLKPKQKFCTECGAKQIYEDNEQESASDEQSKSAIPKATLDKPPVSDGQSSKPDDQHPQGISDVQSSSPDDQHPQDISDVQSSSLDDQHPQDISDVQSSSPDDQHPQVTSDVQSSSPDDQHPQDISDVQSTGKSSPQIFKSKRSIILSSIIAAVLIILFGSYKYIEYTLNPSKVENKFIDAVKNQNVGEMESTISQNDKGLTISKDSVADFLKYFKNHPDFYSGTINNLDTDVSQLSKNSNYYDSNNPISIVKGGKKWLLFNHYSINFKPYYIDVTSNHSPTEVFINGKDVGKVTGEKSTFGPYLLSDFTVKGSYKGIYTNVQQTLSLDPFSGDSQHLSADLDLDGNSVSVFSNMDTAILYVDGKSTGKSVQDLSTLGPVPINGTMKLQAVLQNGSNTRKSNVAAITENNQDVELDFAGTPVDNTASLGLASQEAAQAVTDHYNDISNRDYADAYNLFSNNMQSKNNLDNWIQGMVNNYQNNVSISNVTVSADQATAVVTFTLTSYDSQSDGSTLVQDWGGKWNLVNEDNQWKLDKPNIQKLGSYTE